MTTYATFTEHNDHEGETWRFYLPIEGNEQALSALRALVDKTGEEYHLDLVPVEERVVDHVVGLGDGDYMAAHTKLAGRLDVAGVDTDAEHWADDVFYKGGIKDLVTS